ncbi:MAG: hypothetical protein WCW13_00300 [archaeon]|jgi:hypothetical protein
MQTINKIYWIVHPAYAMAAAGSNIRRKPEEVEAFIKQNCPSNSSCTT